MQVHNDGKYFELKRPGFEEVEFTQSTEHSTIWHRGVAFAEYQNSLLPSAREAIAFRLEAQGKYDANEEQVTRTCAIHFKDKGDYYLAIDDIADEQKNIVHAFARKGYNLNRSGLEFFLPMNNRHVAQAVKRAEKADRIVKAYDGCYSLATRATKHGSAFGRDRLVQAVLGDVAEPYAAMLHRTRPNIHQYSMSFNHLDKECKPEHAFIGLVRISHLLRHKFYFSDNRSAFTTLGLFYNWWPDGTGDSGYARGVRNPTEWRPAAKR